MDHVAFKCETDCEGCIFCGGGLFHCTKCDGFECSLTSECPGEAIGETRAALICAGVLDFRGLGWVELPIEIDDAAH